MDALAQEAARARDATLHARIAFKVAAGNKLLCTIPKAAPGTEAGSFGLAAKVTDLVDLSEYEIRRLATMGRNNVELQRLEVAEASRMLVRTRTKQQASKSKPSGKKRIIRPEAMPSLVRRSGRKRFRTNVGGRQEAGSPGAGDKGHTSSGDEKGFAQTPVKGLAQTPVKQTTTSVMRMRTANDPEHTRDNTPLPRGCRAKLWKEVKRITESHPGTSCR